MAENQKVSGSKNGVQTMLFYYYMALEHTVEDPKQCIATELGKMIQLSEEQVLYVIEHSKNNKILDNLSSSISLLENIEKSQKLDLESISIVKQVLTIMKSDIQKAVDDFVKVTLPEEDLEGDK